MYLSKITLKNIYLSKLVELDFGLVDRFVNVLFSLLYFFLHVIFVELIKVTLPQNSTTPCIVRIACKKIFICDHTQKSFHTFEIFTINRYSLVLFY